jgi:hypothetical protein
MTHTAQIVPPGDDDVIGSSIICTGPEDNDIEPFMHTPIISDKRGRDWAEEMDKAVGLILQGKYMPSSYSQQPAPPPPAPWYPPQCPTLPPLNSLPTEMMPWFQKLNQSCDHNMLHTFLYNNTPNGKGHLSMCPLHSKTTIGPPEGLAYQIPAISQAGETLHPTKTPQSKLACT